MATSIFPILCITMFIMISLIPILMTSIKIVPEEKRLVVHRLGRRLGEMGPGLVFVIPFIDKATMKDVGAQALEMPRDDRLAGVIGSAVTDVYREGEVEVNGNHWNAISDEFIRSGDQIRVKRVILEVERV